MKVERMRDDSGRMEDGGLKDGEGLMDQIE